MHIKINIKHTFDHSSNPFKLNIQVQSNHKRIALFGASGSGKTLTVQTVAGLIKPEHGFIQINNNVFLDTKNQVFLSPQKRKLAYLLQDYGLFPHLTVAQNICFGLNPGWFNKTKKSLIPAQAQRWIDAFNLGNILDNYPNQISGGQKQRTALARALSVKPNLIILDEPLAALDVQLRTHMRSELSALQQQLDIPSILITHDEEDLKTLADEVFKIQDGISI